MKFIDNFRKDFRTYSRGRKKMLKDSHGQELQNGEDLLTFEGIILNLTPQSRNRDVVATEGKSSVGYDKSVKILYALIGTDIRKGDSIYDGSVSYIVQFVEIQPDFNGEDSHLLINLEKTE